MKKRSINVLKVVKILLALINVILEISLLTESKNR